MMAAIRKRSWTDRHGEQRQAWLVDYRDSTGKRRAKQFARKKDAEAWSTETAHQVRAGTHIADSVSGTVAEAAKLWVSRAEMEGRERSTVRAYEQLARIHVVPFLGGVKLSQLTRPQVENYRDQLVATRSRAMAAKGVRALSSILAEAQRRGLVGQNAAAGTSVTRPSRDRARVAIPSKSELRHMLANAGPNFRPMMLTAVLTGMRASELRGLAWAQIDLKGGTVSVERRVDLWGTFGPPKSAAGHRTIPIPPALVSELREWKLRCPKGPLGLAFPNSMGEVLDHTNMVRRRYMPTQEGLAGRYGFHALRHAAASAWIRQGVDLKRVGSWLGHSSVSLTVDRYGHLIVDTAGDAVIVRRAAEELLG
jgi:integrase